jgi:hypothetical protein
VYADQSNLRHAVARRSDSAAGNGSTADDGLRKENQRLVELREDEEMASITDRDADHESIDEGRDSVGGDVASLTNRSRDLAQAGIHGHPLQTWKGE